MGTIKKAILAALTAGILLSLLAGTASALRSISSSETLITLLSTAVSFGSTNLGTAVICEVGLSITLAKRAFAKTERVGIARALVIILRCSRGTATVLGGPFAVNYISFTGTLPTITSLNLQLLRVAFLVLVTVVGVNVRCLIVSNALGNQVVNSRRELETLTGPGGRTEFTLEAITVTPLTGTALCPEANEVFLRGTFAPVRTATVTLV